MHHINKLIYISSLVFIFWGLLFIYNTSFTWIDGTIYSSLFDDAMISMRYAWNFANGNGLVWNAGEYIQGYSNLLMTLLMSAVHMVVDHRIAVFIVQFSGIMFVLLAAFTSMRICKDIATDSGMDKTDTVACIAFILVLCYYPLSYWSIMGMETGLLTVFLLNAVLWVLKFQNTRCPRRLYMATIFLILAFMTRSEAAIAGGIMGLYCLYVIIKYKHSHSLINWIMAAVVYMLCITCVLLFQYSYYGEYLPNTYTLKITGTSLGDRIVDGVGFITPHIQAISLVIIVAIAGIYHQASDKKILLLALVLSSIVYQIYIGGDAWPYWRITTPIMPLLIVLFIVAVYKTRNVAFIPIKLDNICNNKMTRILHAGLLLAGALSINYHFLPEITMQAVPFNSDYNEQRARIGISLAEITTEKASVGVISAGAIPYYSMRAAVDFLGKSDPVIARLEPDRSGELAMYGTLSLPGHNKYDLDYSVGNYRPSYIEQASWGRQRLAQHLLAEYQVEYYQGIPLLLKSGDPTIRWELLDSRN